MISILLYKSKKKWLLVWFVYKKSVVYYYYLNYSYRAFIEGVTGVQQTLCCESNYVPSYITVSKKKEREGGYTFTHACFQSAAGGVYYIIFILRGCSVLR